MTQTVAGRTTEIEILDGLLADRSAEPRALLVEGPPGIGKTTLLRELLERARATGYAARSKSSKFPGSIVIAAKVFRHCQGAARLTQTNCSAN